MYMTKLILQHINNTLSGANLQEQVGTCLAKVIWKVDMCALYDIGFLVVGRGYV